MERRSYSQSLVASLTCFTMLPGVMVGPEGKRRGSFCPVASILTLVPPTSMTRIFGDLAGAFDFMEAPWKMLCRLGDIIARQPDVVSKHGMRYTDKKFEVNFEDGTSLEGESPEVLNEENLTSDSRPVAVSMSFSNYVEDNKSSISVALHHGIASSYNNRITISGQDTEWVNANFQALRDCLGKSRPQDSWIVRHPTLLLNLIALGIGTTAVFALDVVGDMLFRFVGPIPLHVSPRPEWLT